MHFIRSVTTAIPSTAWKEFFASGPDHFNKPEEVIYHCLWLRIPVADNNCQQFLASCNAAIDLTANNILKCFLIFFLLWHENLYSMKKKFSMKCWISVTIIQQVLTYVCRLIDENWEGLVPKLFFQLVRKGWAENIPVLLSSFCGASHSLRWTPSPPLSWSHWCGLWCGMRCGTQTWLQVLVPVFSLPLELTSLV